MVNRSWPFSSSAPSSKDRSIMRPEIWGVTVTDSKAPLRPISSRYTGTSCVVARVTVTSGANCGRPAACVLFFEQPDIASKPTSAAIVLIILVQFIQLSGRPRDLP